MLSRVDSSYPANNTVSPLEIKHADCSLTPCLKTGACARHAKVKTVIQRRNSVYHSTCIGPGKLDELKKIISERNVEHIIFSNTLPSSQVFKVQKYLGGDIRVIDRNLLVLEVFEKRAMTKEAKLQIQLARLRYTFSWGKEFLRLEGILGEQVGWSGPGDYPYSEYERASRQRISRMEKALRDLYKKKDLLRNRRHELGFPIIALAGYTQSGKTTFFNHLTAEGKTTGLGPFTTLSTVARRVCWPESSTEFILVDSIGFIEDMHPIIVKAFNTTLGEIAQADIILIFVDVSESIQRLVQKLASTDAILRQLDIAGKLLICANKVDLIEGDRREEALRAITRQFPGLPIVQISALTGENFEELFNRITAEIHERRSILAS